MTKQKQKSLSALEKEADNLEKLSLKLKPGLRKKKPFVTLYNPKKEVDKAIQVCRNNSMTVGQIVRKCMEFQFIQISEEALNCLGTFDLDVEDEGCDECGGYVYPKFFVQKIVRANNEKYLKELEYDQFQKEKYRKELEEYISYTDHKLKEHALDEEALERKEYERLQKKFGAK